METLTVQQISRSSKCMDPVLLKTDIDGKMLNAKYNQANNNIYVDNGFTIDEVLDCLHPNVREYFSKNNHIIFRKTEAEKKETHHKYARTRYLIQETCTLCNKSYSISSRSRHLKTKLHIENASSQILLTV
jgi:hypothetical protein